MDKHTSRQNWHTDCEKELNNQIGREFQASYQYFSLYTYFDRDDIGLEKIAKFFKKMSDEERDHAIYIAFGPYVNPRYALSVFVEHGGNGSTTAAPMAKKLFKLIIDRHILRQSINKKKYLEI